MDLTLLFVKIQRQGQHDHIKYIVQGNLTNLKNYRKRL